ncbi:Hypothetical protein D9617_49g041230 [Elsinoe fawcettii]|nr:Hypothetical protein D9617_49g041230 [Elsinoe fawcettii]
MDEDGGRYRNLEQSLGEGSTLALGIELGESYWKKFLPKSGIHTFLERANKTRLPELSIKFTPLRKEIVRYYLNEYQVRSQPPSARPTFLHHIAPGADASSPGANMDIMQDLHAMQDDDLWADVGVEIPAYLD